MSTPAILEGALLAQAAGFAVHYQRGKRAFEPRWSTSPPKIAEELRRDYRDGYNIGFRTGDWSKLDGWPIGVLDADAGPFVARWSEESAKSIFEWLEGSQ